MLAPQDPVIGIVSTRQDEGWRVDIGARTRACCEQKAHLGAHPLYEHPHLHLTSPSYTVAPCFTTRLTFFRHVFPYYSVLTLQYRPFLPGFASPISLSLRFSSGERPQRSLTRHIGSAHQASLDGVAFEGARKRTD